MPKSSTPKAFPPLPDSYTSPSGRGRREAAGEGASSSPLPLRERAFTLSPLPLGEGRGEGSSLREQLITAISHTNAPWPAAGLNYIDKVIDPRDTRIELTRALERARGVDGQSGRSERNLANWPRMA